MRKVYMIAIVLLFGLAAAGCMHHTFDVGKGAPNGKVVYDHWHSHWFFGIFGDKKVDIDEVCKSGNATIKNHISFVNGLIGMFTAIVWYPTTVEITCGGGGKAELELSVEEAAKLVADPEFLEVVRDVAPERLDDAERAHCNADEFLHG
jgi:hypothetical protein